MNMDLSEGTLSQRKQEKRDRIVAAAMLVFGEYGFRSSTMAQVAKAADVGKGTLYEYFSSKEELYFSVFNAFIHESFEMLATQLENQEPQMSATDKLRNLNALIVRQLIENRDQYGLFLEFWSASGLSALNTRMQEAFSHFYDKYTRLLARVLEQGQARGEFRSNVNAPDLAAALVGAWDSMGLRAWFDPEFALERTSRTFMDVVLAGMAVNVGRAA